MPPITLTTDFGTASPYVAAMKGVILSVNPAATIHDLTHAIPSGHQTRVPVPGWRSAASRLPPSTSAWSTPASGPTSDPAGGGGRVALLALTRLFDRRWPRWRPTSCGGSRAEIWRRPSCDATAATCPPPSQAHLSLGVPPADMGPMVAEWVTLKTPEKQG